MSNLQLIEQIRSNTNGLTLKQIAQELGLSRYALYQWKQVPANRVMDIVALTEGRLKPEDLRPDVFRAA